jgi:glycosyltransferase involved in cell wall biosynthesis
MRIAILCPEFPPDRTGLADHTAALAEHLAAHADVVVVTSVREALSETSGPARILRQMPQWGWRGGPVVSRLLRQLQPDWLIVQYVPHMYGRGGINLMLPLLLWWWRWRGGATVLFIHELYLPWSVAPKRVLAAVVQRLMLVMCIGAAQRIAVSTDVWRQKLQRLFPFWQSRFHHLPISSNIPVIHIGESEKASARARVGLAPDEVVVGFFGTLHDSKLMEYVVASLGALEANGQRARLLCIGPTPPEVARALNGIGRQWNDRIVCTGYAEAARASHYLSLVDIFLLPLIDGVSSRRSSLMAALSHRVPVVATSSQGTDHVLLESAAVALSPVEDISAFLKHVCALAADETRREQLAEAGEILYQNHFSWSVVIHRLLTLLEREDGRA